MGRIEEQLKTFKQANNLKVKPVFGKGKVYTGLTKQVEMTEQELINSIEFTGFIDGLQGNPKRLKKSSFLEGFEQDLGDVGVEVNSDLTEKRRYNAQYVLGQSYRSHI